MIYLNVLAVVLCVWSREVFCGDDWCEVKGLRLAKGDTWQEEGQCVEVTCQGNNATTALGCPLLQVDVASGWTLSAEDITKSYPDCCPQPLPPANINPNTPQPPQCAEEGIVYQVGQHKDIAGWCGANVCSGDNEWTLSPCGLVATPNGWTTIPEDLSKPYPECCSKAVPSEGDIQTARLATLDPIDNENSINTDSQDSVDIQNDSSKPIAPELSSMPVDIVAEIDLQEPVLKGDLTTVTQEDSEYWTHSDDSIVQNVRSTFPNDQAGLKRLLLSKIVTATTGSGDTRSSNRDPKEDSVTEEGSSVDESDSKKVVFSEEKDNQKTLTLSENIGSMVEVGPTSDSSNTKDGFVPTDNIQEESGQNNIVYSAENSIEADDEDNLDDVLSNERDTDDSKEGVLWFGIFK